MSGWKDKRSSHKMQLRQISYMEGQAFGHPL